MARTRSGAGLIADVRKRSDTESATVPYPDAEIIEYVNQGIAKYHALMRQIRGDRAFGQLSTRSTVSGQNYYSLNSGWTTSTTINPDLAGQTTADLAAILEVFINADGVQYPLLSAQTAERAALTDPNAGWSGIPRFFGRRGSLLELFPTPTSSSYTITMMWVPAALRFSLFNLSDLFDGVDGWETMVIDWAAMRVAEKDHNMVLAPMLKQSFEEAQEEISRLAHGIDDSLPHRCIDVRTYPPRLGSNMWRRPWGRLWR